MEPTLEHVAWAVCGLIGYGLVHVTLVVLEARARLVTARHDLVVSARRLRVEYWAQVAARRDQGVEVAEIVEDDDIATAAPSAVSETVHAPAAPQSPQTPAAPVGRVGPADATDDAAMRPAA
jgi:hypothetical protein